MQDKKEKLLIKADQFARDRNFKKAISLYEQAVQLEPSDIRTRLRLSELLYQAGKIPEALTILQFVGDYYKEHGFLLKAVAVYKKMLEVDPGRTQLHGILADLFFKLGMVPDAIRQYKSQIRALVRQGRVGESLYVVRSMLELDPQNVADRLKLAEQFSRLSMIDEAGQEYRRVLKLLERRMKTPEWGRVALRFLHHVPDDTVTRKKVIEWLVESQDFLQALQHLYVVLVNDSQDTESLRLAAHCFEMLAQPDKAIVVLKTLAHVYLQNGLAREERNAWAHVLQLDPDDPTALKALGLTSTAEVEAQEVELEWTLPEEMRAPLPPEDDEPSFSDDWADERTLVETTTPRILETALSSAASSEAARGGKVIEIGGLSVLVRSIQARNPIGASRLEAAGLKLLPGEREELDFFMNSGFPEEALQVLRDIHKRLSGGRA